MLKMNTEFYGQLALYKKKNLLRISTMASILYSLRIIINLKHGNLKPEICFVQW